MSVLPVKFKLEPGAVMPKYAKPGDAGLDLVALNIIQTSNYIEYDTGVRVEIPDGYFGLLAANSRVSKYDIMLANGVGIIEKTYRGTLRLRYRTTRNGGLIFSKGDVVGQLVILPLPVISPIQTDQLSETERGEGGFGSTA